MRKETERPEALADTMQQPLAELVEQGSSRRAAAAMLEIPPSAVSKRMLEDASFAEAAHAAEKMSEAELLGLMRKHCQKSWQATRWLLECIRPERYCKRKGAKALGPSVDEVFDAVIGVLTEEIADAHLRARIETRLDGLATREFFNAPATAAQRIPGTAETSSEVVEPQADQVDEPPEVTSQEQAELQPDEQLDEQPDEPSEELADELAEDLEQLEVSQRAAADDAPQAPATRPAIAASVARLANKPTRASPAQSERERQQAEAKRRRRKQGNKDRNRQRKMRNGAKKSKKSTCRRQ